MAIIIRDSFDFYTTFSDAGLSYWDIAGGGTGFLLSTNTRFGVGQSIQGGGAAPNNALVRTIGSNQSTIYAAFSLKYNTTFSGTNEGMAIQLLDSGTAQVTVALRSDGAIVVRSGGYGGTVVATFTTAYAQLSWVHFQIKCVINNTTGSVTIRTNGDASDTFTATGLNTRGGTSNNYCTQVAFGQSNASISSQSFVDDLAFFDTTGSAPWNTWVGDMRAVQIMPTADTAQKQFTPSAASSTAFGISAQSGSNTLSVTAGQIRTSAVITSPYGGTLGTATLTLNAGYTGKAKVALYDSDGASVTPGTLLATATEITNPVTGDNVFTFGSPYTLTINHKYFLALITDTTCTAKAGASSTSYTMTQAYASGFPATLTGSSGGANALVLYGTITVTNAGCVQELLQDGSATYVFDSTPGDFDLYDMADLLTTPSAILGVSVRAFVAKSDAGARSGALRINSGATSLDSSTLVLSTTFQNLVMVQDTDPNTSVAWTPTAINALKTGAKVIS